jgi:hypothetical protein
MLYLLVAAPYLNTVERLVRPGEIIYAELRPDIAVEIPE